MKTRDRILDTSLALFNEEGEADTTTIDIANEMDISPGNLYYHFKGKEQVVEELYAQFHARVLVALQEITAQTKGDPKEILAGLALVSDILQQFKFVSQDLRGLHERYPRLRASISKLLTLLNKTLVALVKLMMDKTKVVESSNASILLANNLMYTLINFNGYNSMLDPSVQLETLSIEEHLYLHFLPFL